MDATKYKEVKTKPSTPFGIFSKECKACHIKKHGKVGEFEVSLTEFTKKCSERWKTMTEKEKRRFNQMSEADKKACKEARKKMKDINAPKKPMSSFFWFCEYERRLPKPDFGLKTLSKELGKKWKDVVPEMKAKFEICAKKDKIRYQKELAEYQASLQSKEEKIPLKNEALEDRGNWFETTDDSISVSETRLYNSMDEETTENQAVSTAIEVHGTEIMKIELASTSNRNSQVAEVADNENEWPHINLAQTSNRTYYKPRN